MADVLEMKGQNPFRIRAYRRPPRTSRPSARTWRRWRARDLGALVAIGNRDVCHRLAAAGVATTARRGTRGHGPLAGKTLVLTGTLRALTRQEAAERIRRRGGRVTGSVTPRTDSVVVGAGPGAKLARARTLGVRTLGEDAFLALVG